MGWDWRLVVIPFEEAVSILPIAAPDIEQGVQILDLVFPEYGYPLRGICRVRRSIEPRVNG